MTQTNFGKRGGTSKNAGRTATSYTATLPDGRTIKKRSYQLDAPIVLAHCNYVEEPDIEHLRQPHVTVVYCPRTHARFGHPPHPAPRMLAAGVRVALGTDSLASAPTLSVLDEMRLMHASGLGIAPETILTMATEHGARALGDAGPGAGRLLPHVPV